MSDSDERIFIRPKSALRKEKKKKKAPKSKPYVSSPEDTDHTDTDQSTTAMDTAPATSLKRSRPRPDTSDSDCTVVEVRRRIKQEKITSPAEVSDASVASPAPAPIIAPLIPPVAAPLPKAPRTPLLPQPNPHTAKLAQQSAQITNDITQYCLNEGNKIGKLQTSHIMLQVSNLAKIISELAMENSYLRGALDSRAASGNNAPRSQAPQTPREAVPSPAFSYASAASKNLPAARRTATGHSTTHPARPAPAANAPPTPRPLLAPNGVLPPTQKQRLASQAIASTTAAPAKHRVVITPSEPVQEDPAP